MFSAWKRKRKRNRRGGVFGERTNVHARGSSAVDREISIARAFFFDAEKSARRYAGREQIRGDRRMARRRRIQTSIESVVRFHGVASTRPSDASRAGSTASGSRSGDTGVRTVKTGPFGFVHLGGRVLFLELGIELLGPRALLAGDDHQPAAGCGARDAGVRERGGDADGGERGERHRVSQRGARERVNARIAKPRGSSSTFFRACHCLFVELF